MNIDYLINLFTEGALLGGLIGLVMGVIAWTFGEKHGTALGYIIGGGVLGLLLGFILVGSGLLKTFGSVEQLFYNADQGGDATFLAIVGIARIALIGAAVGGAIASLGRAVVGAVMGLFAGTTAGILLILLNGRYGLAISGPVATMIIAALTLILLAIMAIGRDADK